MQNTILIVEDDSDIGRLVSLVLEMEGYTVTLADNAITALAGITDNPPDFIISDVMMPGLTGLQLLTVLKENERTADIPVMMMSALTSDSDVLAGQEAGADYYLRKPFTATQLIAAVKGVFATASVRQRLDSSVDQCDEI